MGDDGLRGSDGVEASILSTLRASPGMPTDGAPEKADWKVRADAAMSRYAAGDTPSFEELYDALAPRLYAFLGRQVRCAERTQDLVQQTFMLMHQARGTFRPGAAVSAWAFAIARHLLIDGRRRARPEVPFPNEELLDAVPGASADETAVAVLEARRALVLLRRELNRLPVEQRELFELVHSGGLSHGEAAAALGLTANAVKIRMHRITTALRTALSAHRAGG